jgi:hypothetical protein
LKARAADPAGCASAAAGARAGRPRDHLREVLRRFYEGGGRVVDTSPLYGMSEISDRRQALAGARQGLEGEGGGSRRLCQRGGRREGGGDSADRFPFSRPSRRTVLGALGAAAAAPALAPAAAL